MKRMRKAPLKAEPGCFFEERGQLWRLDALDGRRWTAHLVVGVMLEGPFSLIPGPTCRLLSREQGQATVFDLLLEKGFETEQGSRDGILEGNDVSGASSYTASIIVTKTRFNKTLVFPPIWITQLVGMWGAEFVGDFFVQLKTLGGYYEARWEEFDDSPGWSSAPLMCRGYNGGDGGRMCESDGELSEGVRGAYVKGSVPDPKKYHDASVPETIVPHLRKIRADKVLMRIAVTARNSAVRRAAEIVLRGRPSFVQLSLFTDP